MGCSSSREALGGVVSPAPERRQGLRSRSLSALTSPGMCRGRNDGGVLHAYVKLPLADADEAAAAKRSAANGAAVAEQVALSGVEDAASATSSWSASSPPPPARAAAADLDAAVLPGLRQIVEDYPLSSSHPWLLYPEQDHPLPPPPPPPEMTVVVMEETSCDNDGLGTPAAHDIPEVVTAGIVRARVDELHEQMEKKKKEKLTTSAHDDVNVDVATPRRRAVVVLYFTSLRGVRRTFEDGRAVRAILRCYGVRVDERDVSMHAAFKAELRALLLGGGEVGPALPRVFVDGGLDLGGAEELRALHEAGELARALAGCELLVGRAAVAGACAGCGDARFAVCETCHGSCKVFVDDEGCRLAGCFQRCPDCNENGLIRCPVCCY